MPRWGGTKAEGVRKTFFMAPFGRTPRSCFDLAQAKGVGACQSAQVVLHHFHYCTKLDFVKKQIPLSKTQGAFGFWSLILKNIITPPFFVKLIINLFLFVSRAVLDRTGRIFSFKYLIG